MFTSSHLYLHCVRISFNSVFFTLLLATFIDISLDLETFGKKKKKKKAPMNLDDLGEALPPSEPKPPAPVEEEVRLSLSDSLSRESPVFPRIFFQTFSHMFQLFA